MATTLSSVLLRAYRDLGELTESVATGGGTGTTVDSKLAEGGSDDWTNGTAFVIRDSAGAGAAPEGEFQRISAFDPGNGTFTVDTAFSAAVTSGDLIGYAGDVYPLRQLIGHVNDALRTLGDVPIGVDTSLTTVSAQTEYAVPVALKRSGPDRVYIQTVTGDSDYNLPKELFNWHYRPSGAGSTGLLLFDEQPPVGFTLILEYLGEHPTVYIYSDKINETLNPDLVHKAVMCEAMQARIKLLDEKEQQALNYWRRELDIVKAEKKNWKPKKGPRLYTDHHESYDDGQQIVYGRYGPHV